jgi:hypothetical protein
METPKENQNITLDRKSKILFVIIGLLIAISIAVTFWRYIVKRDYIIQAQTDCDPTTENCFVWQCDSESTVEGEACTGDPEKDIWYYKIIHRNAKNIPPCDPNDEDCAALVCEENELECSEEFCTAENVTAPDICNDPAQYNIDNPLEEEAEECAPDDEECLNAQNTEGFDETCTSDDESCRQNSEDEEISPNGSDFSGQ